MMTPTMADKIMIHRGTISGFGSGIGTATIFTSFVSNDLLCGVPMYGTFETRDRTIVEIFNGIFGAIYSISKFTQFTITTTISE